MEYNNRKIDDNKYTAMMGDEERWHTTRSNVYRNVNKELADGCEKKAADWRAMREAWEAMENVCELVSYGVYSEPDNCLAEAKAALAKARVE